MIDTDRLDIAQPIDLSVICNTGLYTIDPLHKHFGIQLTDEVRQTQILEYRIIEFMSFSIIFVLYRSMNKPHISSIFPVYPFLSLPVLAEPSCCGPPLISVSLLYILILTPFSESLFSRFLLCGQIILYRIYIWSAFSFSHTVEHSH